MSKDKLQNKAGSVNRTDLPDKVRTYDRLSGLRKHWWVVGIIALLSLGVLGAGLRYLEQDANRQTVNRQSPTDGSQETSLLNAVNPFITNPPPTPAPQLSKEYIYAGGKMLAVADANADAAPPADLAVWRPSNGYWYVMGGNGSQQTSVAWGTNGDQAVPGDFDGDGKTDFSVFRPSTGYWYIQNSSDSAMTSYYFGLSSDKVAPADYDGDGRTDVAVFRNTNGSGYWYIRRSSDGGLTAMQFGLGTDTPAPADYDGDGKADIAVWRPGGMTFFYVESSSSNTVSKAINMNVGGKPVPADYDGDGKADAAIWGAGANGNEWHITASGGTPIAPLAIGAQATDIPVQNDYDGDGRVDRAVWRGSNGTWYIQQSTKIGQPDEYRTEQWGTSGDIPVPAFYRR